MRKVPKAKLIRDKDGYRYVKMDESEYSTAIWQEVLTFQESLTKEKYSDSAEGRDAISFGLKVKEMYSCPTFFDTVFFSCIKASIVEKENQKLKELSGKYNIKPSSGWPVSTYDFTQVELSSATVYKLPVGSEQASSSSSSSSGASSSSSSSSSSGMSVMGDISGFFNNR